MKAPVLGICLLATLSLALPAADLPRPAPAAVYSTTTGGKIDLAAYRGKAVILEFLNTDCPHCQRSSVMLQKLYQEYGPRGFQVLGVATNQNAAVFVPGFIKKYGLSFPVGYTEVTKMQEFLHQSPMMIPYVPHLVFIDRQGTIRDEHVGELEEKEMRARIEMLLKSAGAASKSAPKKAAPSKSNS